MDFKVIEFVALFSLVGCSLPMEIPTETPLEERYPFRDYYEWLERDLNLYKTEF